MKELVFEYANLLAKTGIKLSEQQLLAAMASPMQVLRSGGVGELASDYDHSKPYEENKKRFYDQTDLVATRHLRQFAMVQLYASWIQEAMEFDGLQAPMPALSGFFPTGSFNAQACALPKGALLLINTGLFMLIHRVLRLMSYDRHLVPYLVPAWGFREPPSEFVDGLTRRETLPMQEIAKEYLRLVVNYVLTREALAAPTFRRQQNLHTQAITMPYVQAVELFALAHEFAHLVLGHLTAREVKNILTVGGDLRFFSKSWDQEMEADSFAVNVLMFGSLHSRMLRNPTENAHWGPIYACAPVLFFQLDHSVSSIARQLSVPAETSLSLSHPPSSVRTAVLLESFVASLQTMVETETDQSLSREDAQMNADLLLQPAVRTIEWFEELNDEVSKVIMRDKP